MILIITIQQSWANSMMYCTAFPVKEKSRYILAGFCEYGDENDVNQFLTQYKPQYDGNAADIGFRTGDLIIGVGHCRRMTCMDNTECRDVDSQMLVSPEHVCGDSDAYYAGLVSVENISDSEWVELATSCEQLCPGLPTTLQVRRAV